MIIKNPTIIINSNGTNLNIHYGETEPDNKNCLWIPIEEPLSVKIDNSIMGTYTYNEDYFTLDEGIAKPSICRYGNLLYIFGGCDINGKPSDKIKILNLENLSMITLETKLSTKKYGIGCACVNDKIYLLGGYEKPENSTNTIVTDTIEVFDIKTNTITILENKLSNLFGDMSCCAYEDYIYCFGGNLGYSSTTAYSPTNSIYRYNTRTNTLSKLTATLSEKNSNCVSVLRGEYIYIFGGYNNSYMVNKFSIQEGSVEKLTYLSNSVMGSYSYGVLGDNIYFVNQTQIHTYHFVFSENFEIYKVPTSKYESFSCFDSKNQSLLILGGQKKDNISKLNIIQELLKNHLHIITTPNYNKANLVETDKIILRVGIDKIFYGNSNNRAETISGYIYDYNTNTWVNIKSGKIINN